MEDRPQESDIGYPEEQPAEVVDRPQPASEDKPQRKGASANRGHPAAQNQDEGTATGNRRAAGGDR